MGETWRLVEDNAVMLMLFAMLAAWALYKPATDLGWLNFLPRGYRRGKRMLRKERVDFVLNLITYDFVSEVENRVYHGEISREEATEIYRRLKQLFPIRNLFPSPELLKERIKNRLGKHIEANFPDKTVKHKPKHMFDRVERVIL